MRAQGLPDSLLHHGVCVNVHDMLPVHCWLLRSGMFDTPVHQPGGKQAAQPDLLHTLG